MTSLSFSHTLSYSTKAAAHTDQVTSIERDEVSDKERQRESREGEIHPLIAQEVWCGFGMGSEVVRCGTLSPHRPSGQQELTQIDKEKERDVEKKE